MRTFKFKSINYNRCRIAILDQMWSTQGCNFNFGRALNGWKVKRVIDFLMVIYDFNGIANTPNRPAWKFHIKGGIQKISTVAYQKNHSNS